MRRACLNFEKNHPYNRSLCVRVHRQCGGFNSATRVRRYYADAERVYDSINADRAPDTGRGPIPKGSFFARPEDYYYVPGGPIPARTASRFSGDPGPGDQNKHYGLPPRRQKKKTKIFK